MWNRLQSSMDHQHTFVRQNKDPAKMTHSIMALVRRGCALLNSWQIQEREGQASVTHADEDVIMRVWCVRLNEHMQMSAAAMTHAGVQRVMCCVREVRKQHPACIVTLEGRLQQRRERVDGADAAAEGPRASLVCSRHVQTKSSRL